MPSPSSSKPNTPALPRKMSTCPPSAMSTSHDPIAMPNEKRTEPERPILLSRSPSMFNPSSLHVPNDALGRRGTQKRVALPEPTSEEPFPPMLTKTRAEVSEQALDSMNAKIENRRSSSDDSSESEVEVVPSSKRKGSNFRLSTSNNPRRSNSKSAHSYGSSMNLSTDLLSKMMKYKEKYTKIVVMNPAYIKISEAISSTKTQIYFLNAVHIIDIIVIVVLISFISGSTLPTINYYNLIHAILGTLGKFSLVVGTSLSQIIAKEYVARSVIKKSSGVPLCTITRNPRTFNPDEGRLLRQTFIASLFLLEMALWLFVLQIKWTPVSTELGEYPCIPATYPSTPTFLEDIPGFLAGDASLATVYNYGLPLEDGLIGGWAAWPLAAPSFQFDVEGDGIVYAFTVSCGDTEISKTNVSALHIELIDSFLWTNEYNAVISIKIPAYAHNWFQYANHSVQQKCTVKYVMGTGHIKFTFVADEWEMVTGGQMTQLMIQDTIITQRMDTSLYFDEITKLMGSTTSNIEIVSWFVEVFVACMNGTYFPPTQAGLTSNLFQWGASGSFYDLNNTSEGISGAIGSMSHYVLMQYNGSAMTTCLYSGVQSSGIIVVPRYVSIVLLAAAIFCFLCQVMQLLRWALTSSNGSLTDVVAEILDSPLLLLHYFRRSISSVIPDIKNGDHSLRNLDDMFGKINVRLGEDKATRGELAGNAVLDIPNKLVALREKRHYTFMNSAKKTDIALYACKNLLKKIPFLKYTLKDGRQKDFFGLVTASLTEQFFRPGSTIMQQGEIGHEMFFLVDGSVNVIVDDVVMKTLKKGSFFGELALVKNIPRTATVVAVKYCNTFCLSTADFHNIVDQFPDIKSKIEKVCDPPPFQREASTESNDAPKGRISLGLDPAVKAKRVSIDSSLFHQPLAIAPRPSTIQYSASHDVGSCANKDQPLDDCSYDSSLHERKSLESLRRTPSSKMTPGRRKSSIISTRRRLSFMVNNGQNDDNGSDGDSDEDDDVPEFKTRSSGRTSSAKVETPVRISVSSKKNTNGKISQLSHVHIEKDLSQQNILKTSTILESKEEKSIPPADTSSRSLRHHSHFSMASDMTDEGMIAKWGRLREDLLDTIYNSTIFQSMLWAYESTTFLIYFCTLLHLAVLSALILLLRYAIGVQVSGILFYNMVHAVTSMLGKVSFGVGLYAAQLISREFTARNMIKRGKGVSLTAILHPVPILRLNAEEGKTLRYIFIAALLLIEATVWFLGIEMEWVPTTSTIGVLPCTRVSYPLKPIIPDSLGNFLQGDSDLSMIYSYGLPLADGVAGGMAAWPLAFPSANFSVSQNGIGFATNVVCGDLKLADPATANGKTQFKIMSSELWSTMYSAQIFVQLPAGSHNWVQFADNDITQLCDVRYIMGDAYIKFGFISDEWGGITSNAIQSISAGNYTANIYSTLDAYYGHFQDEFTVNDKYSNITSWVSEGIITALNNTSYSTSQGALFCNLFQWGTLPDGYYHTEVTWKGVAAVVAMIAHYVLLQYDNTAISECQYDGMQGAGIIECPSYVTILTVISIVICIISELAQLFWWFLLSGGGDKNDRAAKILYSPTQLLYDIHKGASDLLNDAFGDDQSHDTIKEHYKEVLVRFGESRHTRPNPVGTLVLGAPSEGLQQRWKQWGDNPCAEKKTIPLTLNQMSELKYQKLVQLNERLKLEDELPRVKVSEAAKAMIQYVLSTPDPLTQPTKPEFVAENQFTKQA
ncbi:anaphase-promoting complex subunit Hcn1 [Entophlyctis luteolus]|nr:anaphase-promoting complex subunit Hcn1 [Entophlyctis luteolus]